MEVVEVEWLDDKLAGWCQRQRGSLRDWNQGPLRELFEQRWPISTTTRSRPIEKCIYRTTYGLQGKCILRLVLQ